MRTFNWTPQTCGVLKEKLKSYLEKVNQYKKHCQTKDVWDAPEKYETYVRPQLIAVFDYVETLGFTREEAEMSFPVNYEPNTLNSLYEKYARNLSSVIYREANND